MNKCFENEENEKEVGNRIRQITTLFLKTKQIKRNILSGEILARIKEIATYITYMRASGEIDGYTNELRNNVYPEEPTRIAKQLKRLYVCLMSLDDNYPESQAMDILWKVAKSSAFPIRINVFNVLLKAERELSTSQIAEILKIGKGTAQRELAILWNMKLVVCRKQETNYPDKFYDYWKLNLNDKFVINLKK